MATLDQSKLGTWFPSAQHPIIISAPMLATANGNLAAEVSKAGGIGMIQGGMDFSPSSPQLAALDKELTVAREILGRGLNLTSDPSTTTTITTTLPLGVGFLLFHPSLTHFETTAFPILRRHRPRAVWLFAPPVELESNPEADSRALVKRIVTALRAEGIVVFFQVGNVEAAREAVGLYGVDVVVAQGIDAGGHQFAAGSGVVTIVPEVVDMVEAEFPERGVVVVAAGGIVDGRGVAAALALGAEAVVMGTRFIVADEASTPEYRRALILETRDGGINTAKSTVHDNIQGTTYWPGSYDGRAIVGEPYREHLAGLPIEENAGRYKKAKAAGETNWLVNWAGTGVGLIKEGGPAGDIVRKVREEAKQRILKLQASIAM